MTSCTCAVDIVVTVVYCTVYGDTAEGCQSFSRSKRREGRTGGASVSPSLRKCLSIADCQTSAVGLLPRRGLYTQQFDYGGDRCVAALRTRGRSRLSFIALFWNGLTSLFPLPHSSLRRLSWFSAVAGPQAAHGFSVISSCVGLLSIGAMTYPDTLYRSSPFFCRNTAK